MRSKVGINGWGTIGSRLGTLLSSHPGVELVGATKLTPDFRAAQTLRCPLYLPPGANLYHFQDAGILVKGSLADLLQKVNIMIDCTPDGCGQGYKPLYEEHKVKVVFQGGEDPLKVAPVSLFAAVNYKEALDQQFLRIPSCNETALLTVITTLMNLGITHVRVGLIRRWADTDEESHGPLNAIQPKLGIPRYAAGIQTVLGGKIKISTLAAKVPTTLMHLHQIWITFERKVSIEPIIGILKANPRIILVSEKKGFKSTADVVVWGESLRMRGDIYEIIVWKDSFQISDDEMEIAFMAGINQKAVVIPGNLDAILALTGILSEATAAMRATNQFLGIGSLRI